MKPEAELIAELENALRPADIEPSVDRIAAIRARAEAGQPLVQLARRRRRTQRGVAVAAVAAVVLAFASGVVFSDDIPEGLRSAAHDLGLPVQSPDFVEARAALRRLGVALSEKDSAAVESADARLLELVERLDAEEQAEIAPVAHELHLRAVEFPNQQPPGA